MKLEQRKKDLEKIAEDISFCNKCELCDSRNHTCPGNIMLSENAEHIKYMLIGEAPGESEDECGKVFCGRAGNLLREAIVAIGLSDFFITNMLKCRPPENRNPSKKEMDKCAEWLLSQIDAVSPKIIICVGGIAHKQIKKWFVEQSYFKQNPHFKLETIKHPSYILRNGGKHGNMYHEWLNSIFEIKHKWSHL